MNRILFALLMSFLTCAATAAEIVVVGPADGRISELTKVEVQQLFSGKKRQVDGHRIQPVDLPPENPLRIAFYEKVLNKSPSQMRSHWARLTFTGRARPPKAVSGTAELNALLSHHNTLAIGYVAVDEVTDGMAVLYRVK